MRYRLFGRTGLRVSELFLGAMTFGTSIEDDRQVLDTYLDAGGNVIDTAVNYNGGRSEEVLGELLAGRRDRLVLATKYTVTRDASDPNAAGNHRKNLVASLETSLRRLRTDYVDVYWVHIWDPRTPIEETMRALDDAVRAGKILYVGISDAPAWVVSRANTLAEWRDWTPFAGLQVPYSLLNRDIEREMLPMAEAFGMSVAAWSPLGGGVLSGKYAAGGTGRMPANTISAHDHAVADAVGDVAASLGVSSAQVALAWTRHRSRAVLPIVGARTVEQLTDNLGALEVSLPDDAVQQLDDATGFSRGFLADFIDSASPHVFGQAGALVDDR